MTAKISDRDFRRLRDAVTEAIGDHMESGTDDIEMYAETVNDDEIIMEVEHWMHGAGFMSHKNPNLGELIDESDVDRLDIDDDLKAELIREGMKVDDITVYDLYLDYETIPVRYDRHEHVITLNDSDIKLMDDIFRPRMLPSSPFIEFTFHGATVAVEDVERGRVAAFLEKHWDKDNLFNNSDLEAFSEPFVLEEE